MTQRARETLTTTLGQHITRLQARYGKDWQVYCLPNERKPIEQIIDWLAK